MDNIEKFLKVISDKNRLRILRILSARKMCVCELSFILGITQPSVSKHIKKLKVAGMIASEQDHFWTNYYIKNYRGFKKAIWAYLKKFLNGEAIVKRDLQKLKKADRFRLCCKK